MKEFENLFNSEKKQRYIINQDKDEMYPLSNMITVSIVLKEEVCYGYNVMMFLEDGEQVLLGTFDTYEDAFNEIERLIDSDYIYETVGEQIDDCDFDDDDWEDFI